MKQKIIRGIAILSIITSTTNIVMMSLSNQHRVTWPASARIGCDIAEAVFSIVLLGYIINSAWSRRKERRHADAR